MSFVSYLKTVFVLFLIHDSLVRAQDCQNLTTAQFAIVVDAGSTSTRSYVFCWNTTADAYSVPNYTQIFTAKVAPGITTFLTNQSGVRAHLTMILSGLNSQIPSQKQPKTPLYFLATGGLRLYLASASMTLMNSIRFFLSDPSFSPYKFVTRQVRILSTEEECVFEWLAVMYNHNHLSNIQSSTLFPSVLELSSTGVQVAISPTVDIRAYKFGFLVSGQLLSLYTQSYLGYGREQVLATLYNQAVITGSGQVVTSPCMLQGDNRTYVYNGSSYSLIGVGNATACLQIINQLFFFSFPSRLCQPTPCAIGPIYQPTLPNSTFYALSAFQYTAQTMGTLGPTGTLDINQTLSNAKIFCSKDLLTVQSETGRNDSTLSDECAMGLYIPTLLNTGLRIPLNYTGVQYSNDTYPVGALIYEANQVLSTC